MRSARLASQFDSETNVPAEVDRNEYVRIGPGSWQPLGVVLARVVKRLHIDGAEDAAT